MEINKINSQTDGVELSEEEKQQAKEKFFINMVLQKEKYSFMQIDKYLKQNNFTVDEVKSQIQAKTCRLSSYQRQLILSFDTKLIEQILEELNHQLQMINQIH